SQPPTISTFFLQFAYLFLLYFFSFFFNATPTTQIYTLSLHDALPISPGSAGTLWTKRCRPRRRALRRRTQSRSNAVSPCRADSCRTRSPSGGRKSRSESDRAPYRTHPSTRPTPRDHRVPRRCRRKQPPREG